MLGQVPSMPICLAPHIIPSDSPRLAYFPAPQEKGAKKGPMNPASLGANSAQ